MQCVLARLTYFGLMWALSSLRGLYRIPGGIWPENHLGSIGTVIYERGVDVQIVLSNLNSIPANLGATAANCGNGWTCADGVFDVVNNGVFDGVFNKTINGDVR